MTKNKTDTTNHKYITNPILNNPIITTNNVSNDNTDIANYEHNTKTKNKLQNVLISNKQYL